MLLSLRIILVSLTLTFNPVTMLIPVSAQQTAPRPAVVMTERGRQLHANCLLIDGHNDLPWEIRTKSASKFEQLDISQPQPGLHTDLPRLRSGGMGAQFWSVWVPVESIRSRSSLTMTLEQIDLVKRMVERYPNDLALAYSTDEITRIAQEGKIASLIGMEGGHSIEESLGNLRRLYNHGARYMTLTHTETLSWADSGTDIERHGGLTPFGEEVVREMNRLGMMVDLSHVSIPTMKQAIEISRAPVLFSHSSARGVADHPRNVPDEVLELLKKKDGVVMVNFFSAFVVPASAAISKQRYDLELQGKAEGKDPDQLKAELKRWTTAHPYQRGTIHVVLDHIDHIARVVGAEHVGLGSDFDGITLVPEQMEDVACYPLITQGLIDRNYSDEQIRGILGGNLLRVMRKVESIKDPT